MDVVAGLDDVPDMRAVPTLIEGVATAVDEALTSGVGLHELTSGAPRHD